MTNIVKDLTNAQPTDFVTGEWIITVDVNDAEVEVYVTHDERLIHVVSEDGSVEMSFKSASSWADVIQLIETLTGGHTIFIREMTEAQDAFDEYQAAARATNIVPEANKEQYAVYGLMTEAAELQDLYVKALRGDENPDFDKLARKELGDILWFVAAVADAKGWSLSDIASENTQKLRDRADRGVLQGNGDLR